jgi:uncharacterized DUF497 family protein
MEWTWDPDKDRLNRSKHGISFDTAVKVFDDPFAFSEQDRHVGGEERWQTIGMIGGIAVVLVAHTFSVDEDGIEAGRIISARRATNRERTRYEQERRRYF